MEKIIVTQKPQLYGKFIDILSYEQTAYASLSPYDWSLSSIYIIQYRNQNNQLVTPKLDMNKFLANTNIEVILHEISCHRYASGIILQKPISYSEIFNRRRRIKHELNNNISNKLDCIIDSTGSKITIRGDYLRHKWHKKRKGWI